MTMCNVTVAFSDKPTENYHLTLQFPVLGPTNLLLWFSLTTFITLVSSSSSKLLLSRQRSDQPTLQCLINTKQQVGNSLKNIVEHFAFKEPEISQELTITQSTAAV